MMSLTLRDIVAIYECGETKKKLSSFVFFFHIQEAFYFFTACPEEIEHFEDLLLKCSFFRTGHNDHLG